MKKILFGVAALGLLGLVGAGLGLKAQDTVEAKADVGMKIFLDNRLVSSGNDDAVYYVHAWQNSDGSNSQDDAMVIDAKTGMWSLTLDNDALDRVIFVREKAGASSLVWEGEYFYNKTGDLDIPTDGSNTFKLNADCSTGSWETRRVDITNGAYLLSDTIGWGDALTSPVAMDEISSGHFTVTYPLDANELIKCVYYYYGEITSWFQVASLNSGSTEFPILKNEEGLDANPKPTKAGSYVITVRWNNKDGSGNEWYDYNMLDTATNWANGFLNSMTCDPTGLTAPDFKEDGESWNTYAASYDALDTVAKDALYIATGSDDGSAIQQAAKRHDVIVAHHEYTAFMTNGEKSATRAPAAAGVVTNFNAMSGNDNGAITIAIVAAAAALLGVGAILVARKRRAE